MLIKKSINSFIGPVLATAAWLMTFNYQDWICATHWQELQKSIALFETQNNPLPPFGLWENIASSDFRLKNQLLSLYLEVGAKERATLFGVAIAAESEQQPHQEQIVFLQNCLWLDGAPGLQAIAIKKLRADDKENPVWMFHQHMLYEKDVPGIMPLTMDEEHVLKDYLRQIGESALASQISSER